MRVEGVSAVTTTLNEAGYVHAFTRRVRRALRGVKHEVVIVDDSSTDGTFLEACRWADKALQVRRAGQSSGLLIGIKAARFPVVATLDVDLENPPELIPRLLEVFEKHGLDLLVACRSELPRFSERLASRLLGRVLGVSDVFSNFRVYRRDAFKKCRLVLGESFGGELLAYAWAKKLRTEFCIYRPPPRRAQPRIGGVVKANARILIATLKLLAYMALTLTGILKPV